MIISRTYATFRQLLNSGDEAGTFFIEKMYESYPEYMWDDMWNKFADQCLYQREMSWAFTKLGDVIEKFSELDKTKPYDNRCTYEDVNETEIVLKDEDSITLNLIANLYGEKIIVKNLTIKE